MDGESRYQDLEELNRNIIEIAPVCIQVTDRNHIVRVWNPCLETYTGVSRKEIEGKNLFENIKTLEQVEIKKIFEDVLSTGESRHLTNLVVKRSIGPKAGETLWQNVLISPLRTGGEVTGILTIIEDITAYKKAMQELDIDSGKFFRAFQNSPDIAVISSFKEGRLIDVNAAFLDITGYTKEEIIGKTTWELKLWDDEKSGEQIIRELTATGTCHNIEQKTHTKAGNPLTILYSGTRIALPTGPVLLSTMKDITERKRAEELLQLQRDLGTVLQTASSLEEVLQHLLLHCLKIEELDAGGVYLVEGGALRLVVHQGLSRAFVDSVSYYAPGSQQANLVMQGKPVYSPYEQLGIARDDVRKQEALKSIAIIPVKYENNVIACLNMTSHKYKKVPDSVCNVLESIASMIGGSIVRTRAEEQLRTSEARYRLFFEKLADGILITDLESLKPVYANPAICEMLGYTTAEILNLHLGDIHPREEMESMVSEFHSQKIETKYLASGIPCLTRNGAIIYVDINASFIIMNNRECMLGLFRNVTERQLLEKLKAQQQLQEKMLIRTQRLSSLGELTTALAHEIRQPLHVMKMITEGILYWENKNPPEDDRYKKYMDNLGKILKGIERINGVIENVYKSTRQTNDISIVLLDCNKVIREIVNFFQQKIKDHNILLHLDLDPAAREIRFSKVQLEQVITNLLSNAIQTLDTVNKAGKYISLVTKEMNAYLLLQISDNGTGIAPQIQEHIFDPLFTTRQDKSALGMGMYIVHNILESFKATIDFENNEIGGVTFSIKFTRIEQENEHSDYR